MRLIRTSNLELVNFIANDVPKYAILSHTWGAEEVTLQEFVAQTATYKLGYQKVQGFCALCVQRAVEWAWIDSVCIDKTNSVELSEAINSMFQWYQRSSLCIAYLSDVSICQVGEEPSISNSMWFTRGWTLQELLAPNKVEFYSHGWNRIGDKVTLQKAITRITGIDPAYILAAKNVGLACVAQRMSWASKRQTTREEDAAYCLLGLFRVNMPLLYGEGGTRAFMRLQEEIIKTSADHTIFAWFANEEAFPEGASIFRHCNSGLLAPSPAFFASSHSVRRRIKASALDVRFLAFGSSNPYQMTNRGLQIEVPMGQWKCNDDCCAQEPSPCLLGALDCYFKGTSNLSIALHIRAQKFAMYTDGEMWQISDSDVERIHLDKKSAVSFEHLSSSHLETVFVRRGIPSQVDE